ncbi:glycosyltransferase [Sulfurimonas sp.]
MEDVKKNLSILIYSLAAGGAERVVSILLSELKSEYNITLVLMNNSIFYNIPEGINIVYIESSSADENGMLKLLKLPFLAFKYKNICKKNSIDISLSFMNRPNYINIISKIFSNNTKILISERIAPSQEYKENSPKDRISKILIKYLYPKADIIIPNAKGIELDLIKHFNIDKNNIQVINNLIDINKIYELKEHDIDISLKKFAFITVGRFFEQKNHKLLIKSMQNIDANLYIIGDGVLTKNIEKYIDEYKLNNKVFLLGMKENPYAYLSKADCFVFSSNYEGFPNVLLEALACGLPVISTDCQSGPREIIAPNTNISFQLKNDIEVAEYGLLTPIKDSINLEKSMNLILENEKLLNEYINKSYIRAENFSKNKVLIDWIKVIDD